MLCSSFAAKLMIVGWSVLTVSVLYHVRVASHFRERGSGLVYADVPESTLEGLDSSEGEIRRYDAVIVGAGWAGLNAAKTFLDAGVTDILVLEAQDYVGGRSKSVNQDGSINAPSPSVDNVPIEAGSEWLYDNNDMGRYLSENNYTATASIIDPRAYSGLLRGAKLYREITEDDGTLSVKQIKTANAYKDRVWDGIRRFRKDRLGRLGMEDESWDDLFDAYKREANPKAEDLEYIDLLDDVSKIEYTCDGDQMSLRENDLLDQRIPATRYMGRRGLGFGNVAARFGERFSSKIRRNCEVTEVRDYAGGGDARVAFVDDGRTVEVEARTVLVTASLGVLKAGSIGFAPRLPRWKRKVIDGMGFGTVNKCAMYWNNPHDLVWPEKFWFKLISHEENRWTYFFNPSSYKGAASLTAWIGGSDAEDMERRTDEEVMNRYVMKNLEKMFPRIRYPDRVHVTRWGRDPNFRGTYSFKATGRNWQNDAHKLRSRVGRLWFGGEATARSWLGTTVGAWKSGEDAAKDMMQTLRPLVVS